MSSNYLSAEFPLPKGKYEGVNLLIQNIPNIEKKIEDVYQIYIIMNYQIYLN